MEEAKPSVWPAVHDHTISVRELGMHLPFDQGESPADTVVGSLEVVEAIQIVDFAGGGHLLTPHSPDTKTGDGEMVPLAIVIQSAFSGCCRTVVGSRPLLNPDSGRRRGTWGRSH